MAQTDLAVRRLADLLPEEMVRALLGARNVTAVQSEPTEHKVLERRADSVVRATLEGNETIVHLEFQASHDAGVPLRVLTYHGLLRLRFHPLPVRSVVVYLMHKPPQEPVPNGIEPAPGDEQLSFTYDVICAWDHPITLEQVRREPVLGPLAPLTPGIGPEDLPRLQQLLEDERVVPRRLGAELVALTFILAGRRFEPHLLQSFCRSKIMLDSATYQQILAEGREAGRAEGLDEGREEGRAETLQRKLCRLVEHRLGRLPPSLPEALEGLELAVMDELFDRALETESAEALEALLDELLR